MLIKAKAACTLGELNGRYWVARDVERELIER
jgi:hypothetical protein